ncbi:MAG: Gfo/Idh/MocA family oxidoreductase, partial [Armatimonadota bacterium]|nr:Gfo/Idh/MocA family oxidoreductase [Armatimonadota bacterium]
ASGIGKNHARWFHQHGCDVCAFVGSSPESVQRTQQILEQGFGFTGRGYHELDVMLHAERPDAVCISSPPPLHFVQTMQCLAAGAHVLCEKPLVYDASKSPDELIHQARLLVQRAKATRLLLAVQTQYVVAIDKLLELTGHAPDAPSDAPRVRDFVMEMETKNIKHGREHDAIWIDLSPHPLSVLQKLAGDGAEIDDSSIECMVGAHETDARFQIRRADNQTMTARVIVRFKPDRDVPLRYFALDGHRVDYTAHKDAQGEFRAYLTAEDGREIELSDFVDLLIGQFVAACRGEGEPAATGADGAQNVEWQLKILQAAQRV